MSTTLLIFFKKSLNHFVNKRYTKPHRHNKYLEIIFFCKGEGFHHLDSKSYGIDPPVVFVLKKEEVDNWEINIIPKGYVIIIKETFSKKYRN
ncbi:AraC family ligand binding domain-containing protein [Mariniflexile ostreae]|uniref:AraC family ligand binding domain-containing protein n=1 Tax=Mariniflexile ostreae TaxID=1520892 RepID=A0ABV5FB40_9FLAO